MIVIRGLEEIGDFLEEVNKTMEENGFDTDYIDENCPLILWDTQKKEWSAIKGFRSEKISGSQFIFKTEFIPMDGSEVINKDSIESEMQKVEELIQSESEAAKKTAKINNKKPLFIIGSVGKNAYNVWSLEENKQMKIWGYKTYLEDFFYSQKEGEELIDNKGKYQVFAPSKALLQKAVLNLFYNEWKYYGEGDVWVKRPERKALDLEGIKVKYPLYETALKYVNDFYTTDQKQENIKYSKLEQKLDRFEELLQNNILEVIAKREYQILIEALAIVENKEA
ncbi:hypothetical protein SAMN05216249_11068 [Acetitomaculum ruminis DSM 5522]|uniref:Uncharacterized protein n=1 Tax=Acetitomaculum ruminis DSM 5522 TaxID=1120918 RepID=A0A1I0YLA0_9FIRM|nr:hypothetical protein [Acetitomaculum ruminis]SFB13586.1 hypothetical protein SAMN05216249_11068 [Acetitomaculum ruminis DSM 5522]